MTKIIRVPTIATQRKIKETERLIGKLAAVVLRQEQLRSDRKHDATLAKVLANKPKLTKAAARQLCYAAVAAELAR